MLAVLGVLLLAQTPQVAPPAPAPVVSQPAAELVAPVSPAPQQVAVSVPAVKPVPSPPPVRPAKVTPRVDVKKPYMRVWYWPPSPTGGVTDPGTPIAPGAAAASGGAFGQVDDVNFSTNLANLVDENAQLQRLAQWMNANPGASIDLEGYADARGSRKHNLVLSQKRVSAVKDYLVKAGVPDGRIATKALGAADPVSGQNKEETFWLSRRVTVRFHKPVATKAPEANPAKAVEVAPKKAEPEGGV